MAAGAWQVYNEFKLTLGQKVESLSADTFKVALFLSTSNCGDVALQNAFYATLTNQHANANGYTTGGVTCAATWTGNFSLATKTFDLADAAWNAAGGSIVARFAVIYDDSTANKDLVAWCYLDSTPADVTVTTGNTLTINIVNVFTLA